MKKCSCTDCKCNKSKTVFEDILDEVRPYLQMATIDAEDIVTLVCTEFVKQNKEYLQSRSGDYGETWARNIPYLKMNFKARRKLSEKVIKKMEQDYENSSNI